MDRASSTNKKGKWYAVVRGKGGCCGLYRNREEAEGLRTSSSMIKSFNKEAKAWEWFQSMQTQDKVKKLATEETVEGPAAPPIALAGKDPSTGKEDEVFGIKTDVSTKELTSQLAPPGVDATTAGQLNEAMVDAAAIPGKAFSVTETEEAQDVFGQSIAALAGISRADDDGDMRLDLRWRSPLRTSLRPIKTIAELLELQRDAQSVANGALKKTMVNQRSLLLRLRWPESTVEAWTHGGYIATISRRSVANCLDLMQHLVRMEAEGSWSLAKQELDCCVKELHLLRANAGSRVQCMCSTYIFLRDHQAKSWRSPSLELKKVMDLNREVQTLKALQCLPTAPGG